MAIGDGVSALATLGVTFGGFSPTAMDGVAASKEYIERLEKIEAKRKRARRERQALEMARTSKPRVFDDGQDTQWTYVVVDDKAVRITNCETNARTLCIPQEIEGFPVVAIAPDGCSSLDCVEEIICPDSVKAIGSCAFRLCSNLRRVVFPKEIAEYSASWVSHCQEIEEIVLPGGLTSITLSVFDSPHLKRLHLGPNVYDIVPGAFQKTNLDYLEIDSENPFIKTDGFAIYSIDGKTLLALARPESEYTVLDGCTTIGKKAFYGIESLHRVLLPESIATLGEFAFSHSGIQHFDAPPSLESIQEKAFYHCENLKSITLNDGLKYIGDSAFEQSSLEALRIPASIESIGASITASTNIVHTGPQATIEIDAASKSLFLDGEGGLYRRESDGVHLIQLIYREAREYHAWTGVKVVDDYAFAFHSNIERISIPEGVIEVGASAFRCCGNLRLVQLPDSVRSIGKDAFLDTELESFRVPRDLEQLGSNALVTRSAYHGDKVPSLAKVEVAPGNGHFYVNSGMLCRRNGAVSSVIIFDNSVSHVVIPDEVSHIEDYAFNNARGIEYLELRPGLKTIGTSGLAVWCWIEHIHVEIGKPLEGRTTFDFHFPNTSKGIHSISMAIGGSSWVNVPGIMAQYDNSIASAHDYSSKSNSDSISVYEQTRKMVARLEDPILLTEVNRNLFDRVIRWHIVEICVDIARNDDRRLIDSLLDFGYINGDNLEEIIAAVNRLQDAAMTGYLLEMKRRLFNRTVFDFDL